MLSEFPVYGELNVIKTNHAFKGYAMSYNSEIVKQLEAIKSSIKDLVSDFLNKTKGFKYSEKLNLGQLILIQQQKQ